MKKKGLIIATIVMVVVLVASLSTATYAWFTVQESTSLTGFDIEVVPSNVLKIGVRTDSSGYSASATAANFKNGNVTYSQTTAGKLPGTWAGGTQGLGATLTHNINFGNVSKAVGFSSAASAEAATNENTGLFKTTPTGLAVVANAAEGTTNMGTATAAVANGKTGTGAVAGDFAYLDLGVAATKELKEGTNNLYVLVKTNGTLLGLGAAIHVAYRVDGGAWTEADEGVYGDVRYTSEVSGISANIPDDILSVVQKSAFVADESAVAIDGGAVVTIPLEETAADVLVQVEVVIYVAGADQDCIDSAISAGTYQIGLYFGAQSNSQE